MNQIVKVGLLLLLLLPLEQAEAFSRPHFRSRRNVATRAYRQRPHLIRRVQPQMQARAPQRARQQPRGNGSLQPVSGRSPIAPPPNTQPYGAEGSITMSEAVVVRGLVGPGATPDADGRYRFAQPQSYQAVRSRLGFPAYRTGLTDYYRVRNGFVAIDYSPTGRAIGFRQ